ncbi:MAG: X-Pro dipeptidyl-peptidase, partial [Arcticibacterium sp.]
WEEGSKVPITANIITRGWADLQNHKALDKSQELIEGDYYSLRFYLNPDDQIIPKGQQIALVVFSSDKEFTLHPRAGTELSLDLKNSTLHLPIVGGKEQYLKCTAP